jgi:hypothetical protein
MGGLGSGRPGRRATVEGTAALELDAAAVVRAFREELRRAAPGGAVPEGRWLDLPERRWLWSRDGEPWAAAEVGLRLGPDWGVARLRFDIEHLTCPTGPQNQTVALSTSPCRFGGLRWWWRCPETDARCAKLLLPNGGRRFLSRAAYGLAYASQAEDAIMRAHRRAAGIHRRLRSDARLAGAPAPPRPRGMRQRTYERLAAELDEASRALDQAFLDGAVRLLGWRRG